MDSFCSSSCTGSSTGIANQYISLLLSFLVSNQCSLSSSNTYPTDYGETALQRGFETYDFIIVGAGTAGSVLANRLSENRDWKILLVEAGGDPPIESTVPSLLASLPRTTNDWQYTIESSNHSTYTGRWPRGKMLGGCSSINGMLYVRGNRGDYNNWEALGNPTWGWENILKYFKKSENNRDPIVYKNYGGKYHATNGSLAVKLVDEVSTISFDIIRAAQEMEYKFLLDPNAMDHIGFTFNQANLRDGVRESAATAFLAPIRNRTNLHVVKNAQVINLLIDKEGVVSGVRMLLQGKRILRALARKEVILSAGAINTPQILMLSGLGPAQHLQNMNLPVFRNLSVGKNLQDHPGIILAFKFDQSTAAAYSQDDLLRDFSQYLMNRTGPFASTGPMYTVGYVNTHDPQAKFPDYQYLHMDFQKNQTAMLRRSLRFFGYNDYIAEIGAAAATDAHVLLVLATYLTPQFRGEILLRGSNPTDKPRITANYFTRPYDIDSYVRAIRLYMRFLSTQSFQRREVEFIRFPIPPCDRMKFDSDEYWTCYARHMITTVFHPVGTAKMGPDSDPSAVVDYRLRVKGTKGLRVVDASIMPIIPRGNTNAPTMMIAEKAADFIKEDWECVTNEY
ncbi:glucose dehydrogenase [FAD, quinone]-like [Lutzomyia longipalpis]|uniref:glucose dehydrogenase [FAD, quinone]-like n=1 Tax=Lutzomyia longipalpis TaxID=7200 RepID=UPI002483D320|nr:glucose dehydrogenase [FAD, quinone]-like [Lutzomyia longipalpis]